MTTQLVESITFDDLIVEKRTDEEGTPYLYFSWREGEAALFEDPSDQWVSVSLADIALWAAYPLYNRVFPDARQLTPPPDMAEVDIAALRRDMDRIDAHRVQRDRLAAAIEERLRSLP